MVRSRKHESEFLDEGTLTFTIEGRILRELGERLVKTPEVALVELVKNAYDADASECIVLYFPPESITVIDNGSGMSLQEFISGWMRIGTSAKEQLPISGKYFRFITGEKGIGRFAVRFLGRTLDLESVADDKERGLRTKLTAQFNWPEFDRHEDLGSVEVPYQLVEVDESVPTGTNLDITDLRSAANDLNLNAVRTGSIGVLSPLRSLFRQLPGDRNVARDREGVDPGFTLKIQAEDTVDEGDVASDILDAYVLRASLKLREDKFDLRIFRRGQKRPYLKIVDTYPNDIGLMNADIRFFPRRTGTFTNMPLDGRKAQGWISENNGVAIFDRNFRVTPYGSPRNDWLRLQADAARNRRHPRSELAKKHFGMSQPVRADPAQNWMLRIPQSSQLVGLVQVRGRRNRPLKPLDEDKGLVASADRQGFVENSAFKQLRDLARGAVEALAYVDRQLQLEEAEAERKQLAETIRGRTKEAIAEVENSADISAQDKRRIVGALMETQRLAEEQRESSREKAQQLEVMSLLGVVAGFMTHEFGAALKELEESHLELVKAGKSIPHLREAAEQFEAHIEQLKEFVIYSTGYIRGARNSPEKPYPVRPRLRQVKRIFGKYADVRNIAVEMAVDAKLEAPRVPVSLYNGVALNLYTNALKAVTAKLGGREGKIAFRAWNEGRWHYLEVSDTGIGIPSVLHERLFEPLFSTTEERADPLGSGMGLGLAFVRRSVEAFGGRADVVDAPAGFSTCFRVRLPLFDRENANE